MGKILPQYRIEQELNSFGMKPGGTTNTLFVEKCLSKFYNLVDRDKDNTIITTSLKAGVESSVKLLIVKCLSNFGRKNINNFDIATEQLVKDFTKEWPKNEGIPVRLIIADNITSQMKKYCMLKNIELIYYNKRENKYHLLWKTKRQVNK